MHFNKNQIAKGHNLVNLFLEVQIVKGSLISYSNWHLRR